MEIEVCKEVCKQCPFRIENSRQLSLREVRENFADERKITPCHQVMQKYTGCPNKGVEQYAEKVDTFMVCRGMVRSRFKSGAFYTKGGLYHKFYAKVLEETVTLNNIVEIEL